MQAVENQVNRITLKMRENLKNFIFYYCFLIHMSLFIYLAVLDLSCSMQVLLLQCVDSLAVMHGLQSTQASVTVNAGAVALRHKES